MVAVSVIRWEEPPAEHGNARPKKPLKYQAVADELRANPNRWAVVADDLSTGGSGTLAFNIRKGVRPWGDGFEAKTVGPLGGRRGTAKVYARYVGESGERAR